MTKAVLKFVRSAAGKLAGLGLDKLSPYLGEAIIRNPLKLPESIIDKSLNLVSDSKELLVPHAKNLSEKLYHMAAERLKVQPAFGQMSLAFPGTQNVMTKPLPEPAYGPYFRPSLAPHGSGMKSISPMAGAPAYTEQPNATVPIAVTGPDSEGKSNYKMLKEQEKQLKSQLKSVKKQKKDSAKSRKKVKKVGLDVIEPAPKPAKKKRAPKKK